MTESSTSSSAADVAFPREAGRVISTASASRSHGGRSGGQQHRLNGVLAIILGLVVVVAPVLLASNRPAFWMLWAVVVGLAGAIYSIRLFMLDVPARTPLSRLWFETLLFALFCGYIVVQMLPLADLFGWLGANRVRLADGTELHLGSLSLDIGSSAMTLVNFLTYGVFLFLAAQVLVNRQRARLFVTLLLGLITVEALYSLVSLTQFGDTLLFFEKQAYQGFATGTFINRNSFATFLASGLAIGTVLLVTMVGNGRRMTVSQRISRISGLTGSMLIIAAALLATGSRMGLFVGVVSVITPVAISAVLQRGQRRVRTLLLLLGIGAVALTLLFTFFGESLLRRVIFDSAEDGRHDLYPQVWQMLFARPWTGYGAGSFASVYPAFQQLMGQGDFLYDKAHSTYLALWFELGFVFGSIPLVIIAAFIVRAVRSLSQPEDVLGGLVALSVTAVFAVHSIVDFSAEMQANAFVLLLALALGIAGSRRGKVAPANG